MAEPELPEVLTEDEPHKYSRTAPGGFGYVGNDDPSNNALFDSALRQISDEQQRICPVRSLDPATLPPLPPPSDNSELYNSENGDAQLDTLDEGEMQRHLNDVESSFVPAPSPIHVEHTKGVDDTYLFDGAQRPSGKTGENCFLTLQPVGGDVPTDGLSVDNGNTTAYLETLSSSPTAAAAKRTIARAISAASHPEHEPEPVECGEEKAEFIMELNASSLDGRSTLHFDDSNGAVRVAANAEITPALPLLVRKRSSRQSKLLQNRRTSQHSSISSLDGSDITLGADYALQSGGAVPASGFSRQSTITLSRSISLGSMASGIEDYAEDSGHSLGASLATLTEEEQNRKSPDESPPETPRPSRTLAAPTDTIIARHVRNVHVPEAVAQKYRTKDGVSSPERRSGLTVTSLARNGRNLTLKEQSSTIERLSKENFDLKLKVMFLSDRLDKLSEEGVKDMISENVELKTGLAVIQRDNKSLKRKVKDLEKQLKEEEDRPSTSNSGTTAGGQSPEWSDEGVFREKEEELLYLRERVEEYITEIENLRSDAISRENDKRNLAEIVRQMGERRGQNVEVREEMDVWKDLLEQETSRREQVDEENRKLREEIFRLRTDISASSAVPGLNHTTNIFNITKKRQGSPSRPKSVMSERLDDRNGSMSAASTLVEELRRESELLRHENCELRREVGAQTSMLTSRNREKERLYQEIEDLKLGNRRGGSLAGESILERSASRAHERSASRGSTASRHVNITDTEREDFENQNAELRDRISELKLKNQDLQRELDSCTEDYEALVRRTKAAEARVSGLEEDLEHAENDLLTMQSERDEALQGQEDVELMFDTLRKEAQMEMDRYALELDEVNAGNERLQIALTDTTENFNALQNEMREMSEGLIRLEDDHESKANRIQELEKEIEDNNRELEQMEQSLVEANEKVNRLTVQLESCQSEISFLREEQDGDKIKIGDLQAAIKNGERTTEEGRARIKELEQRLTHERRQREAVAGKEKHEIQQYINQLNRDLSTSKDEARRLRKKEVEAAEWKQKLTDLEDQLRIALGEIDGTRSSFLNSIAKLHHELEDTVHDLDRSKESLAEKDRVIKQRDELLETHALEARKLADMLDKERQYHRNTKHQFETYQRSTQHTSRSLSQQETRVIELENSRQYDRRKITLLENQLKDQMAERNQLLLTLWGRLSTICGSDWTHNNRLIEGRALPSLESVNTMLPGFAKNMLAAVKRIETLFGEFTTRIRSVEKDLWKEYQTLETHLEIRSKRLDKLEAISRSAVPGLAGDSRAEIHRLREQIKLMKVEIASLRAAQEVHAGMFPDQSPSPSVPMGPRHRRGGEKTRTSALTRQQQHPPLSLSSASASETLEQRVTHSRSDSDPRSGEQARDYQLFLESKWQARLHELEDKLKAEREARLLDRSNATQRLNEKSREYSELVQEMERFKIRGQVAR